MSNCMTGSDIGKLLHKSIVVPEAKGNSLLEDAGSGRQTEHVVESLDNVVLVTVYQILKEVFVATVPLIGSLGRLSDYAKQVCMLVMVLVRLHEHVKHVLQLQDLFSVVLDGLVGQLLVDIFGALDGEAERGAAERLQAVQEGTFQLLFLFLLLFIYIR